MYAVGPTALQAAAKTGDTEMVARLLQDPRVEPNKISSSRDAHAYAVIGNCLDTLNAIRCVIESKILYLINYVVGPTALHAASEDGRYQNGGKTTSRT